MAQLWTIIPDFVGESRKNHRIEVPLAYKLQLAEIRGTIKMTAFGNRVRRRSGGGDDMPPYIMALDAGTTSNRCILFDREGNVCSMAQKEW